MIKIKDGFIFSGMLGRMDFAIWQLAILLLIAVPALMIFFEPSQASSLSTFGGTASPMGPNMMLNKISGSMYQPNYFALIAKYIFYIVIGITALYVGIVTMVKRIKDLGLEKQNVAIVSLICLTASFISLSAGLVITGALLLLPTDILSSKVSNNTLAT